MTAYLHEQLSNESPRQLINSADTGDARNEVIGFQGRVRENEQIICLPLQRAARQSSRLETSEEGASALACKKPTKGPPSKVSVPSRFLA